MNMQKVNKIVSVFAAALLVVTLAVVSSFISRAENVTILEGKDPNLTFIKIHEKDPDHAKETWDDIDGSFNQNDNTYSLTSNGYAQWWKYDSLHFAYKKVTFNYGNSADLVLETQLDSWNGINECAGAGLMIRAGLNPSAATVMLHTRPECIMITYRSDDKMESIKGPELTISPNYPVKFKMVLSKNKVTCYYKQQTNDSFIKFGTVPFKYSTSVYGGLSAYSQQESFIATAKFTGYDYKVNAPEGTVVSDDDSSDTGNPNNPNPEKPVVLPQDPSVSEDVILYETFTDNSMTEGNNSQTNPLWKTNNPSPPEIITTPDNLNRYLYEYMQNNFYKAGDEHWTDYETSIDLTFTSETAPNESNMVDIYTRLTSIAQYGYHSYVVRFKPEFVNGVVATTHILLGYMEGESELSPNSAITVVQSYDYNYLNKLDETIHVTVRTFDNKISVQLNGTEIMSWTDDTQNVRADGCIGFSTYNASVNIDNIKVIKLEDLLGGDYDNSIGGLWDQPTPSYINEFKNSGFIY